MTPEVTGALPRFQLYDEEGVFGVFDSAGPHVYFSEDRDRALAEVRRANEIVAVYPTAISMRHLREMDAEWRAARGLPPLPEPEGRKVVVPAPAQPEEPGAALPEAGHVAAIPPPRPDLHVAPPAPAPPSPTRIAAALQAAADVAAGEAMQRRVERTAEDLAATRQWAEEIARLVGAVDAPMARFRAALAALYGPHAGAAEDGFRRMCASDSPERAVALLREDPRALLPAPRPSFLAGGTEARAAAAEQGAVYGPLVARLGRAVAEAGAHAGVSPPAHADLDQHRQLVQQRLRDLIPAQEQVAAAAVAELGRTGPTLASADTLRREWAALDPAARDAVRVAAPDLDRLLALPGEGRHARRVEVEV